MPPGMLITVAIIPNFSDSNKRPHYQAGRKVESATVRKILLPATSILCRPEMEKQLAIGSMEYKDDDARLGCC
jgi:hypothetical protein